MSKVPLEKHYLVKAARMGVKFVTFVCQHRHPEGKITYHRKPPYLPDHARCGNRNYVSVGVLAQSDKKSMAVKCAECGNHSHLPTLAEYNREGDPRHMVMQKGAKVRLRKIRLAGGPGDGLHATVRPRRGMV